MLVLTRSQYEKILVTASNGEVIEITIVSIQDKRVRVGIEAPPAVKIFREEIAPPKKKLQ